MAAVESAAIARRGHQTTWSCVNVIDLPGGNKSVFYADHPLITMFFLAGSCFFNLYMYLFYF